MSTVRILDEHDVRRLLPMDECIEVMARALAALARGEVHNPLRFVVRPPDAPSLIGLMPAYRGAEAPLWGLKSVVIAPSNAARGLDLHQGFVALFDGETGSQGHWDVVCVSSSAATHHDVASSFVDNLKYLDHFSDINTVPWQKATRLAGELCADLYQSKLKAGFFNGEHNASAYGVLCYP